MKKQLLALAVTGALCLGGLSACGGSTSTNNNTANNTANTTNTTATTNTNKNANAASTTSGSTVISQLESKLSACYMGVGGDYKTGQAVDDFDITYYMGFSEDGSWGVVVAVDVEPDSKTGKYEYISFVGSVASSGDTYTILDDATGNSLTFSATEQTDGTWILDLGTEIGKAQVASCSSSDLVQALTLINEYGEPMD